MIVGTAFDKIQIIMVVICPNCKHSNRIQPDELLGMYVVCKSCSSLFNIVGKRESKAIGKDRNKDENGAKNRKNDTL